MDGKVLWVLLGCALGACSGRTSSGQLAGGGAAAPTAPEWAGQSSVAAGGAAGAVASSDTGGMTVGVGLGGAPESVAAAGERAAGGEGDASSQAGGVGGGGEPAVEFPPRAVCGPSVVDYDKRYCPDLEILSLNLDAIEDAGGDGGVSPGEEARAVFSLHDSSSRSFVAGPCVGMLAATPGLTVLESYNPSPHLYGVTAGAPDPKVKIRFRVEPGVAPGTRIPLLAWLDVQGGLCPNGYELRFELRVAP